MNSPASQGADWKARLDHVVDTVREMSAETDPQKMVRNYIQRMRTLYPADSAVSLSRRGLEHPQYRITRSHLWQHEEINPWKQPERLPLLNGGLLGELIYSDRPHIIDNLIIPRDDPAYEHLAGMHSLIAVPHFNEGVALNMVVHLRKDPAAFSREDFPDLVLMSNLFGRATHNLVLSSQLRDAYDFLDSELKVVADIQRSLLPVELPKIPGLELAAYYQTSRHAGGDYYDFFPLPDGKWGMLIADVSGHGTPAAVVMAITHTIAHSHPGPPTSPQAMLEFINRRLAMQAQRHNSFVTAVYGIFDPQTRVLTYSSAGHPPPRVKRADGSVVTLDAAQHLPLGIIAEEMYSQAQFQLAPGDLLLLYTDGITEARNPSHDIFGLDRLDAVMRNLCCGVHGLVDNVLEAVRRYESGRQPNDDQTLLGAYVQGHCDADPAGCGCSPA